MVLVGSCEPRLGLARNNSWDVKAQERKRCWATHDEIFRILLIRVSARIRTRTTWSLREPSEWQSTQATRGTHSNTSTVSRSRYVQDLEPKLTHRDQARSKTSLNMCKYAAANYYQRNTHKKREMQLCTFPIIHTTVRGECTQELPFPEKCTQQPFRRSNAKWVALVVVFGVASSSHTATGDGFNGKHNILQVNIARNRTLHILQRCSGEDRIAFLYIFQPRLPLLGSSVFHLTRISCGPPRSVLCDVSSCYFV